MVVEYKGDQIEIKPITRPQRRTLHHLNKQVYDKSEFKIVDDKPEITNLVTDHDRLQEMIEMALDLAFENTESLDDKYDDTEQDVLAQIIAREYLGLSKKKT